MKFKVLKKLPNSGARLGALETPHGVIQTPVFMPVATAGAVKTLAPWEVKELGAEIILGNTYHLHLRPGEEIIKNAGGIQKWMRWDGPVLTDSGGYQAYSLGGTRAKTATLPHGQGNPEQRRGAKTTNDGVRFYSHLDGSKYEFTPESVLDIQAKLGSDIVMPLDDCPPIEATEKRVKSAVIRTREWAKRSIGHWQKFQNSVSSKQSVTSLSSQQSVTSVSHIYDTESENRPGLFGIVQGGMFKNLREESLKDIQSLPFDGIAVGGVAIASEGKEKINNAVGYVAKGLDPDRPHYLMGVGYPDDIIRMVGQGFDMFDCVLPTRLARHGVFWTTDLQQFNLRRSEFRNDTQPLDIKCQCRVCQSFDRSYLRHLYTTGETLAGRLLTYHNLSVTLELMSKIRASIEHDDFAKEFAQYL